jgi:aminoglycoside 3-N-acetyltransferase
MHDDRTIVTRSRLVADFQRLGLKAGDVVMLHASVKSVGWVVGGPDVIIQSLLEVLSPSGTLMMYVAWADGTYDMAEWPEAKQQAYRDECPPFDPNSSRACMQWSILTEYLRTWPGACRSANPEASCVAVGVKAEHLTADHPMDYGYGEGSPFEKLCHVDGRVLMLGAPFNTITLLHYSESMANILDKRVVRYTEPILKDGAKAWVEVEEFDTGNGVREGAEEYFVSIAQDYLASGKGTVGRVGDATTHLFQAAELHAFAVAWLEREFGH